STTAASSLAFMLALLTWITLFNSRASPARGVGPRCLSARSGHHLFRRICFREIVDESRRVVIREVGTPCYHPLDHSSPFHWSQFLPLNAGKSVTRRADAFENRLSVDRGCRLRLRWASPTASACASIRRGRREDFSDTPYGLAYGRVQIGSGRRSWSVQ